MKPRILKSLDLSTVYRVVKDNIQNELCAARTVQQKGHGGSSSSSGTVGTSCKVSDGVIVIRWRKAVQWRPTRKAKHYLTSHTSVFALERQWNLACQKGFPVRKHSSLPVF